MGSGSMCSELGWNVRYNRKHCLAIDTEWRWRRDRDFSEIGVKSGLGCSFLGPGLLVKSEVRDRVFFSPGPFTSGVPQI